MRDFRLDDRLCLTLGAVQSITEHYSVMRVAVSGGWPGLGGGWRGLSSVTGGDQQWPEWPAVTEYRVSLWPAAPGVSSERGRGWPALSLISVIR